MTDLDREKYIRQRIEALEEQRQGIEDRYAEGSMSEDQYKEELSKNDYLMAEIRERNDQEFDREQTNVYRREIGFFRD